MFFTESERKIFPTSTKISHESAQPELNPKFNQIQSPPISKLAAKAIPEFRALS